MGTKLQKIGLAIIAIGVVGYLGYRIYMAGGVHQFIDSLKGTPAPTPRATVTPKRTPTSTVKPSVSIAPVSGPRIQLLATVNRQRVQAGLAPLIQNDILAAAAQAHAQDMAIKGYFSHDTPSGVTFQQRMATTGYMGDAIAENIGLTSDSSIETVVTSWMNSAGHKANILGTQYHVGGMGLANGMYQGQPVLFAVFIFGSQ